MRHILAASLLATLAVGTVCSQAGAQTPADFQTRKDVTYATHDGVALLGDLFLPMSGGSHPAMIFIHGGALIAGSKAGYAVTWGPYLAQRGYVVFSIDYRLGKPNQPTWPQALLDCKAAIQYVRGNAAALGVNPERIGVGGDSAGGVLSSLLGVTQDFPAFANKYPQDPYATVSTKVKVAVPVYGVFDMMLWEKYTLISRAGTPPFDQALGGPPFQQPGNFFEASSINYIRAAAKSLGNAATPNPGVNIPWFVTWGTVDSNVPAEAQSVRFVQALKDAGANVTAVPVPNVDHFWFPASQITGQQGEPVCIEVTVTPANPWRVKCNGATPNDYIAPKLLDFLANNLGPATLSSTAAK